MGFEVYIVLLFHWMADFIAQTDKQATNKSSSWRWLSAHVLTYTLIMSFAFGIKYGLINGITHLFIDAVTSRASSHFWKKGDRHNFFVVIGLDQLLHTCILIYTLPHLGGALKVIGG